MDKKKIIKIVFIIIAIILVIFLANVIRKYAIISSLETKLATQLEATNVYAKYDNDNEIFEVYRLDNTSKHIIYDKKFRTKTTTIGTKSSSISYYEEDNGKEKTMSISQDGFLIEPIPVYLPKNTFLDKMICSIGTKISSGEVNGKECYIISGLNNQISDLMDVNATNVEFYLDKDTGLILKRVETIELEKKETTVYEYSFGSVTEEDVAELDASQYKLVVDEE